MQVLFSFFQPKEAAIIKHGTYKHANTMQKITKVTLLRYVGTMRKYREYKSKHTTKDEINVPLALSVFRDKERNTQAVEI